MNKDFICYPVTYSYFVTLKTPIKVYELLPDTVPLIQFFYYKSSGSFILLEDFPFNKNVTFEKVLSAADDLVKNGYLINCSFSNN